MIGAPHIYVWDDGCEVSFAHELIKSGINKIFVLWNSNHAPNKYLKFSIDENTYVPLYELVYHEAVVTSWSWEAANHHAQELWWKKDLFNILYGTAPLWNLACEQWEDHKVNFIESYNNGCPWL